MKALLVVMLLIIYSASTLGLDFSEYKKLALKSDKANRAIVNSHLDAIATSFITYERMVSQAHGARLICMPNKLRLTPRNIEEAIEYTVRNYPKKNLSGFPVSELAFMGLAVKYSCPQSYANAK